MIFPNPPHLSLNTIKGLYATCTQNMQRKPISHLRIQPIFEANHSYNPGFAYERFFSLIEPAALTTQALRTKGFSA